MGWRNYAYGNGGDDILKKRNADFDARRKALAEEEKLKEYMPSYLVDKRVNEILDISSRIGKQTAPISTFKATDNEGKDKTYNIYSTERFTLPPSLNKLPTVTKKYDNVDITSLSTLPKPNKSFESMTSKELLDYTKQNRSAFNLIDSRKRELNKLIGTKQNEEYVPEPTKKIEINNPILKFLDRIGGTAADTATYGTGNISKSDTGNKVANTVADIVGTGLGMAVNPSGMAESASSILGKSHVLIPSLPIINNKTIGYIPSIGKAAENTVSKLPLPKIADKLVPAAAKGAAEFGTYGAMQSYANNEDIPTTLKNIRDNALGGAAFGAGAKTLGMTLPKLKNTALPNWKETYSSVMPLEQQNKLLGVEPPFEIAASKTPKEYKGKFTLVNTELRKAQQEYDNAIEQIQNHFRTNKLTPGEIPRVKSELGIDLPKLVSNLETAKTNVNKVAEDVRLARTVGAKTSPLPKLPNIPKNKPIENPMIDLPQPKAKIVSSSKDKSSFIDSLNNFYTRLVDINYPIKKVGDRSYTLATNSKNVGGTVDYILKDGLVDRNGKRIGSSLKDIAESIPKGQENDFWEYVLQRHNVARAAEGKPIYSDFTPEMSSEKAKYFESINPTWKNKANNITNWLNTFMDEWGVNSGITDKELYSALRKQYPNYIPTNRDFSSLEQGTLLTNGRGFVNQSKPIKKATGSDRNITDPLENIMNLVNRTVRTARYNEVGQSLVDTINKNPEIYKSVAEIVPGEVNSSVKNIVSVLVDGKPINVQINDKSLLDSLQKLNQSNVGDIEKAFKKATGVFKSLITQKNPFFAVKNIARDLPTAYINGSENNPIKYGLDLIKAGKDLTTNSLIAQQYKALGGGGSNFFSSDNVAKSAKELINPPLLKRLGNGIEKFNNLTESAPRLAEFKRVANKTGDMQKALFAANDVSTNFSRGGDITKHIDSVTPYLNASVQGLDKLVRQFKNKPIETVLKGATAITAPTLVLNYINKDNPNYQQLDDRTKDTYFLIPKEDGTFFKLPKSRELGVLFGSLTERILRKNQGDKKAFSNFRNTLKTNFGPTSPAENNIFSPLLINLPKNKDFANRTIVPQSMQDRSPQLQYDETTSEIGKKIGEIANLSPKQVDYVIKSYTGVVGQLLLPSTTKNNKGGAAKAITTQFVADPLYSNQVLTDFYDNYDKYKNLAADKNFVEDIDSKVLTKEENIRNYLAKASKEISALSKESRMAERTGDMGKVRELRQKMIDIAKKANSTVN